MIPPSRFRPDIVQYAWVVPNLEEAARHWHATMGVGPFLVNRHIKVSNASHRGIPGAPDFSTAVAQSGDVQIELVEQHDSAPSVYRDTVPQGATGFHHIAFVDADYEGAMARYAAQGHRPGAEGWFGDMRYSYVDTTAAIGCMTEILEDKPGIRAFFAAIRKAAEDWDGNPETLLIELTPR